MNPIIVLKNFRSYGEGGADFELAPVTVLTGCNSAGKSSLVKALLLLSKKSNSITSGSISYSQDLKLTSKEMNLGGYKTVAHDNQKITMSYTIWSSDLQDVLSVERVFCESPNDVLNNGTLYQLTVKKSDGTIIYQLGPGWLDGYLQSNNFVNTIKAEFDRFYAVGCYNHAQHILKLIAEVKDSDGKEKAIKIGEDASKKLLIKLSSVGLNESDAELLWNQYNFETWKAVIEMRTYSLNIDKRTANLSDLTEEPNGIIYEMMVDRFMESIIGNALSPYFTQNIEYINSASAQIARLYLSEDDNKMSLALRLLNSRNKYYQDHGDLWAPAYTRSTCKIHVPGSFLNRWLEIFGIADAMELIGTTEGLGFMAYLKVGENKRLLADEGYGITQLVSLLLQIDNSIPLLLEPDKEKFIQDKKVILEYHPHIVCVEEPENHLHPKFQSLLADMFVEAYQKYNIRFIIETHSEYLIRKLQVMVADKDIPLTTNDVSLNYIEKGKDGKSHNKPIRILEDGGLSNSFGAGFYDEADTLAIQLFRNKPILS